MTDQVQELDVLKRKLAKRRGMPGFEENARELERRIAELEAGNGADQSD